MAGKKECKACIVTAPQHYLAGSTNTLRRGWHMAPS
jgi:hypothetical protein